jgi:hypothetical protein
MEMRPRHALLQSPNNDVARRASNGPPELMETHVEDGSKSLDDRFGFLVTGPSWGDAVFYGKWLLAASRAGKLSSEAHQDLAFLKKIDSLTVIYDLDFSIAASLIIMQLTEFGNSLIVHVDGVFVTDHFAMMAGMGFFRAVGCHHHMSLPNRLRAIDVRRAILKYAETEDEESMLHPEYLVAAMPLTEARTHQIRLRALHEFPHSAPVGHA